jgi:tetratricopeptide (TPR) repeat protein
MFQQAQQRQEQILRQASEETRRQLMVELSRTLTALGSVYVKRDQADAASKCFEQARDFRLQLVESSANTSDRVEATRLLSNTEMNLGLLEKKTEQFEAAQAQMESAQNRRQQVLRFDQSNLRLKRDLAKGSYNLANLLFETGDAKDVHRNLVEAMRLFEELVSENSRDLQDQYSLAVVYRLMADLKSEFVSTGQLPGTEAVSQYEAARKVLQNLAMQSPDVPAYQLDLVAVLINMAELQRLSGNNTAESELLKESGALLDDLAERGVDSPRVREYQQLVDAAS